MLIILNSCQLSQGDHNWKMSPVSKQACLLGNTAMHVLPCCFADSLYLFSLNKSNSL